MPLDLGVARPSTPQARSHGAATVCRASRAAPGPCRRGRKVAQSGSVWGVFRAPVHHVNRGGVRGSEIRRWSPAIVHRTGLGTVKEQREGGLPAISIYNMFAAGRRRRSPAMALRSRHAKDLEIFRRRNGPRPREAGSQSSRWTSAPLTAGTHLAMRWTQGKDSSRRARANSPAWRDAGRKFKGGPARGWSIRPTRFSGRHARCRWRRAAWVAK
jgi:hypothetical protein